MVHSTEAADVLPSCLTDPPLHRVGMIANFWRTVSHPNQIDDLARTSRDLPASGVWGLQVCVEVGATCVRCLEPAPSNACLPADSSPISTRASALAARRSTSSCCPRRLFLVAAFETLFCTSPTIINQMRPSSMDKILEPSRQFVLRSEPSPCRSMEQHSGQQHQQLPSSLLAHIVGPVQSNAYLIQRHVHRLSIRPLEKSRHCLHH